MKMNLFCGLALVLGLSTGAFAAGGSEASGLPNPASANCVKSGGKLTIADTQMGEIGICAFGRAAIEEWTLFRSVGRSHTTAEVAYLKHPAVAGNEGFGVGMANPASVYCARLGGQGVSVRDRRGEYALCEFKDRSAIEEWTLYAGPQSKQNRGLTAALMK